MDGKVLLETCRACEGGSPKCKLGESANKVEMRGVSYTALMHYRQTRQWLPVPTDLSCYDIMVIYPSPSFLDDLKQQPFQSAQADKGLEFLKASGLPLDKVWMTYAIKCVPPKKRKPAIPEIKTCLQHLKVELDAIHPEVIIPVGTIPLRAFKLHARGGIRAIKGKLFNVPYIHDEEGKTYKVVPTVDPAGFLKHNNARKEALAINDYRNANKALKNLPLDGVMSVKYTLVDTLDKMSDLIQKLGASKRFAFDTESGRLGIRKHRMLCMSFTAGDLSNYVLPFYRHIDPEDGQSDLISCWSVKDQELIFKLLEIPFKAERIGKIAHHIKYDINVLRFYSHTERFKSKNFKYISKSPYIKIKGLLEDTMIKHHILDEEPPHSLEFLTDLNFGFGDYAEELHKITGTGKELKAGYDEVPDKILWDYTAVDSYGCFILNDKLDQDLMEKPHLFNLYYKEQATLCAALAEAEHYGFKINTEVVDSLKGEYEADQAQLLTKLEVETYEGFNPLSHPQLIKVLIKKGFEDDILAPDKSSGYCADKHVLTELAEKSPFCFDIMAYRTNRKLISTYLVNIMDVIDDDGRARYGWKQHGTSTGRLSNTWLHQLPSLKSQRVEQGKWCERHMVEAREGYIYVYADYSQVELRILASIANDKEMLRIFEDPNADIHTATSAEILGAKEEGVSRIVVNGKGYEVEAGSKHNRTSIGKRVNFGFAYGSQGYSLVNSAQWEDVDGRLHNITWEMLNKGMARWYKRFSGVEDFIKGIGDVARGNGGIIVSPFGRERRFGNTILSSNKWEREKAEREAVNHPIQSTAGSITNRTINEVYLFKQELLKAGSIKEEDFYLINTVHDSVIYEVLTRLVPWFQGALKTIGTRPIPELGGQSFELSMGTGNSWATAEMDAD